MKINLPPDIKIIVMPLVSLLTLLILGYLLFNLGLTRILAQGKEIESVGKEVTQLEQKNSILNEVTPTIVQNANLFSFALPSEDPTPMVFSQLKSLSGSAGVSINSLSSRPGVKASDIPEVALEIDITGSTTNIFSFLAGLNTITPLVVVNSVTLGQDKSGGATADIALSSFWSAFPEVIPASTEPISDLSADEKEMIAQVSSYKVPIFTELTPVPPSSTRTSPF